MAEKIKIVIVDDQPAYRTAIFKTVGLIPECEILGVCKDGREALDLCLADPPDVLLTDLDMPRLDGIELIKKLLKVEKEVKVVVLTIREDQDAFYDAFRYGALGYLLKTSTPQDVVEGIRLAHKGEAKITPKIAARMIEDFRRLKQEDFGNEDPLYELSQREGQILEFIRLGMRNKDIATKIGIAEKTVKNHVSSILKALQVNSRTEAAIKAMRNHK